MRFFLKILLQFYGKWYFFLSWGMKLPEIILKSLILSSYRHAVKKLSHLDNYKSIKKIINQDVH